MERKIDNDFAAKKMIDILFKQGYINFATYERIQEKYKLSRNEGVK